MNCSGSRPGRSISARPGDQSLTTFLLDRFALLSRLDQGLPHTLSDYLDNSTKREPNTNLRDHTAEIPDFLIGSQTDVPVPLLGCLLIAIAASAMSALGQKPTYSDHLPDVRFRG